MCFDTILSVIVATANVIVLEGNYRYFVKGDIHAMVILSMSKVGQSIRGICRYFV